MHRSNAALMSSIGQRVSSAARCSAGEGPDLPALTRPSYLCFPMMLTESHPGLGSQTAFPHQTRSVSPMPKPISRMT